MHQTVSVDQLHPKNLPETVKSYNVSKVGVEIVDRMADCESCKSVPRRGPVRVFFNITDCACINAYIIYTQITSQSLTTR